MTQSNKIITRSISLVILITFLLNISCTKGVHIPLQDIDKTGWSEEGDYHIHLKSGRVEECKRYMIESDAWLIMEKDKAKKIPLKDIESIEKREISALRTTLLVSGITVGVCLLGVAGYLIFGLYEWSKHD